MKFLPCLLLFTVPISLDGATPPREGGAPFVSGGKRGPKVQQQQDEIHLPYEHFYPFPYIMKTIVEQERQEHRIQQALASAEQVVVDAVQDEVQGLFPTTEHNHDAKTTMADKETIAITKKQDGSVVYKKADGNDLEDQEDFSFVHEYLKALGRLEW